MKKIKNLLIILLLLCIVSAPKLAYADSGLDANYSDGSSPFEALGSAFSSGFSFAGNALKAAPEDENYGTYHVVASIICIIICYIFTCRYIFKLDGTKKRKKKKILLLLGISLLPTLLFSLVCLLTETYLILYIFLLLIYILVFKITTKIILSNRLKNRIKKIQSINKDFTKEVFNDLAFNTYKDIQIAWMNFDIKKLKELVSSEIFEDYKTKLDKLKEDKQKNIMDNIEFKSNKIKYVTFNNDDIIVDCEMKVTCNDYIINDEEKVIKGKKDKVNNYKYKLAFNIKNKDKYILAEKKMSKQK